MSRLWICGAVADASDGKWRHRVGAATALRLRTVGGGVPRVAHGLATAGLWAGIPLGFAEWRRPPLMSGWYSAVSVLTSDSAINTAHTQIKHQQHHEPKSERIARPIKGEVKIPESGDAPVVNGNQSPGDEAGTQCHGKHPPPRFIVF